jgi:hypothetical protein
MLGIEPSDGLCHFTEVFTASRHGQASTGAPQSHDAPPMYLSVPRLLWIKSVKR